MKSSYNSKKVFIVSVSVLVSLSVFAVKDFTFTYDSAGNRILRSEPTYRSVSIIQDKQEEVITDTSMKNNVIKIFPNPTPGNLTITIENLTELQKVSLTVFDIKGQVLITKTGLGTSTLLDITSFPSATYVLRVVIDRESTEWKIIKK